MEASNNYYIVAASTDGIIEQLELIAQAKAELKSQMSCVICSILMSQLPETTEIAPGHYTQRYEVTLNDSIVVIVNGHSKRIHKITIGEKDIECLDENDNFITTYNNMSLFKKYVLFITLLEQFNVPGIKTIDRNRSLFIL